MPVNVEPGTLVSHYRIVRELGHGSMAHVYRATDLNHGRDVALKVPHADGERGPDALRRFLREVRVAVRLIHPSIVAVHGGFEHEGRPWLVMELVEGPTLGELIDVRGPLPPAEVLACGAGLAAALGVAHARGILHHDISPNNIVMAADGRAKLLDFGLASLSGKGLEPSTRKIVGTPGYIAPEKILGQPIDARSDVFSLGAVLFEMLTGRPAFPGSTREEILDATLTIDPPAITAPGALGSIVARALAKSAAERYSSANELEADLRSDAESANA